MSERIWCALCDEPVPDVEAVKWTVDPWGKVHDYAHKSCKDNWEPLGVGSDHIGAAGRSPEAEVTGSERTGAVK